MVGTARALAAPGIRVGLATLPVVQPHPLASGSALGASRPSEGASSARAGQIPRKDRPFLRLCFLSAPALRAPREELAWEANAVEQRRLAELGFGLALGIEPGERAALGWAQLSELVRRTGAFALAQGFVAGAGCEQVGGAASIAEQLEGVAQQAGVIEEAGGVPVLLPLASLARRRATEHEYVEFYRALLARVGGPVIIDWTGPRLRPELLDYFPGKSFERVMALEPAKVRGVRFGLLDEAREVRLRRALVARDQLLFTADRAHLAQLLLGGNPGAAEHAPEPARFTEFSGRAVALGDFSHLVLAGLASRAEALAAALERLAAGDAAGYLARLPALE